MEKRKVLVIRGSKLGKGISRAFRVKINGRDIAIEIPYTESERKKFRLIRKEVCKRKDLKPSEVNEVLKEALEILPPVRELSVEKVIAELFVLDKHSLKIRVRNFKGKRQKNIRRTIERCIKKNKIYKESDQSKNYFSKTGIIEIGNIEGDNFLERIKLDISVSLSQKSINLEGYEISYYGGTKIEEKEIRRR